MLARRTDSEQSERFTLRLSSAVPAAELRAWFRTAKAGARTVYAEGLSLPQAEAGVALARELVAAGCAETHNMRDPADARRWLFVIVKKAALRDGACAPPQDERNLRQAQDERGEGLSADAARLLDLLRDVAERGGVCPSLAEMAVRLDLGRAERGRQRAAYLQRQLETGNRIAVTRRGTAQAPAVVRIDAPGRAQGLSTSDGG